MREGSNGSKFKIVLQFQGASDADSVDTFDGFTRFVGFVGDDSTFLSASRLRSVPCARASRRSLPVAADDPGWATGYVGRAIAANRW